MKSVLRTFIAVDISPAVQSGIQKAMKPLIQAFPDIKWVNEPNFHVTLKFLGDVPMTGLYHVIREVEKVCRDVEPFDLVFSGIGAFPNMESPRSLWVGVQDGVKEIQQLAGKLDAALQELGFPPERRGFSPHLTLGRTRWRDRQRVSGESHASLQEMLEKQKDRFFGCSPVDAVIVYSSELRRNGPLYDPLATIELSPVT